MTSTTLPSASMPSQALASPTANMDLPQQHSTSRRKRSRHASRSPSKSKIQTSLYQYPSKSSLESQSSCQEPSLIESPRVFTTVIPPLAGVPPTGPLPPTPPLQSAELVEGKLGGELGLLSQKVGSKGSGKLPKVEVVIGIIADHTDDEFTKKRSLRRVKGTRNIANAATICKQPGQADVALSRKGEIKESVSKVSHENGLPTPSSTPPSAVFQRHYAQKGPEKQKQPVISYVEEGNDHSSDDDDDGGISIEYDEGHVGHGTWVGKDHRRISECFSTPGIPRPDSPFIMGFEFPFENDEEQCAPEETLIVFEDTSAKIRLSTCRKSHPEFTAPVRINSEKAVIEQVVSPELEDTSAERENSPSTSSKHDATLTSNKGPAIPMRRTSTGGSAHSLEGGGVPLATPTERAAQEKLLTSKDAITQKGNKNEFELCMRQSSIAKRRLTVRRDTPPTIGEVLAGQKDEKAKNEENSQNNDEERGKEESTEVSESSKAVVVCAPSEVSTTKKITISDDRLHFTPPSLPRFNFIPPTPLPLATPGALLEKQLGEPQKLSFPGAPPRTTSSGATSRSASRTRPSLASQPSRFRDSKLHPWWKPRTYWDEEQDLARVLSSTNDFAISEKGNSKFSEELATGLESLNEASATNDKRRRWSAGGFGTGVVRVDKKRRVVTFGGKLQIEFIGIDGLMGRLKGKNKKDEGESVEGPATPTSPTFPISSSSSGGNKLQKRKAVRENVATDF